jgi:hypothetical protein
MQVLTRIGPRQWLIDARRTAHHRGFRRLRRPCLRPSRSSPISRLRRLLRLVVLHMVLGCLTGGVRLLQGLGIGQGVRVFATTIRLLI